MPAITKKKKSISASINILESKEGDHYIAHCLEFDLVSQGATREEAKDNLAGLIFSYLQFAMEHNIEQFTYHPAPKIYWDRFKEVRKTKVVTRQSINPALLKAPRNRIKDFMKEAKIDKMPTHA